MNEEQLESLENQWIENIWVSDFLLELPEKHILHTIDTLQFEKQKETFFRWSGGIRATYNPGSGTTPPAPKPSTDGGNLGNFIEFIQSFRATTEPAFEPDKLNSGNPDVFWYKMLDSDKTELFDNDFNKFLTWFDSLTPNLLTQYTNQVHKGESIYPTGVVDFMKEMFDYVGENEFLSISIIKGNYVTVSSNDIMKLNQFKITMQALGLMYEAYRKKTTDQGIVMHSIVYKVG